MKKEIWGGLGKFPNYLISSYGQIKNIKTNYIFNERIDKTGYRRVCLTNCNGESKHFLVHVLVAMVFLNYLPVDDVCVDHINGERAENNIENLRVITKSANCLNRIKQGKRKSRAVNQLSLSGEYIRTWPRIKDAMYNKSDIIAVCKGRKKTCGGYKWEYTNEEFLVNEIWEETEINGKKIKVSNQGRVQLTSGTITYGNKNPAGYKTISIKNKGLLVHRIVASIFCTKCDGCDIVDHIDRNKENNQADNLRWCTRSQNGLNQVAHEKNVRKRAVVAIDKAGKEKHFLSIADAARSIETTSGNIWSCCSGKRKTAKGYIWRYLYETQGIYSKFHKNTM